MTEKVLITEKIGSDGKFWVREFPIYLTSHTKGKQNAKKYFDLKGADQNAMQTRRRTPKHKKR